MQYVDQVASVRIDRPGVEMRYERESQRPPTTKLDKLIRRDELGGANYITRYDYVL